MAGADSFIRRLPQGYDTLLTQGGSGLSQGERQLLTIARAVLQDAPILILDEATSSVDTVTEQRIRKAMLTITEGRTSFIIAHRLSTIRDSDLILLMEDMHGCTGRKWGKNNPLHYTLFSPIPQHSLLPQRIYPEKMPDLAYANHS